MNSFRKNYEISNKPNEILLVSQNQSLEERYVYDLFFQNFIDLYNVTIIKEIYSDIFMPYNNYKEHSTENGFYFYKLIKKL